MIRNVTEVLGRSEQGVIRPFICRCDDGRDYFVKGSGAGRRALVCEWVASRLALELDLPVPPIDQVRVERQLVAYSAREDLGDLGAGVWFGSRSVDNVIELPYSAIAQIEPMLRAKVLLFDWWVLNSDRTLGQDGGNPNLLWEPRHPTLHVIDHTLTFELGYAERFWEHHIFAADQALWTETFRERLEPQMVGAIEQLEGIWNEMPEEWYEEVPGFGIDDVREVLHRYEQEGFWRMP